MHISTCNNYTMLQLVVTCNISTYNIFCISTFNTLICLVRLGGDLYADTIHFSLIATSYGYILLLVSSVGLLVYHGITHISYCLCIINVSLWHKRTSCRI